MVVLLLIMGVFELITFLLSLLPNTTISYPDVEAYGATVGDIVGPLNALLPIAELATVTVLTVTVLAPAVLLFRLIMWLWKLVPVVGGGS